MRWSRARALRERCCRSTPGRRSFEKASREERGTQRRWGRASPRAARLRRLGELVPLRVAPEALEFVEIAALAAEDVHDEVEIIEQDPLRFLDAFLQVRALAEFRPQRVLDGIGDRRDLARV